MMKCVSAEKLPKCDRARPRAVAWLLAVLLPFAGQAAQVLVSTPAELTAAAAGAQPGDTILMLDGAWPNADLLFSAAGTATQPITLRAQTLGRVTLTGQSRLRLAGNFLVVDGLTFTNGYRTSGDVIAFQDSALSVASHSRLTNCAIVDYNPPNLANDTKWVSLYGVSNRVEGCYFKGKANVGATLVVWVSELPDAPNHHRIARNYFGPRPGLTAASNGGETIRVGLAEVSFNLSRTLVEENFFERCNGDVEIISSKSRENIFRRNTFFECEGALTLRHGNGSVVEENYFLGNHKPQTGGVRVIGEDHRVINNYFADLAGTASRSPLALMQGLVDSPLNGYFQVKRATVAFNTFVNCTNSLLIGLVGTLSGTTNVTTLPPVDCMIANNLVLQPAGKIVDQRIAPQNLLWEANILFGTTLGITTNSGTLRVDPQLAFADGLWRPRTNSPALSAAQGSYAFVTEDFEGQPRPAAKDIGCDQVSLVAIHYPPLTATNVGPLWMRERGTFLTWTAPADIAYGTPLGAAQLNALANAAGTFTYDPPTGTILETGSNQILTVVFTPNDVVNFTAATQSVTISVSQATPLITWATPAPIIYGTVLGASQFNVNVNASGSFQFLPPAGTVLNVGSNQELTVNFTPEDTNNFRPASRTVFIQVLQATPALTWAAPAALEQGVPLSGAQLNASAPVPGTFVYAPPAGTLLAAGAAQPLTATFTPADTTNYNSAALTIQINVTIGGKTVPAVIWPRPAPILSGSPLGSLQLNATANVPGSFTYTPSAGTVLPVGHDQILSVAFTPSNSAAYASLTNRVLIDVADLSSNALVRVAYLVPTNRTAQSHAVASLRQLVLLHQKWFSDQMERNGFGHKTFICETEPDGVTPVIHVLPVAATDSQLRSDIYGARVIEVVQAAGLPVGAPGQVWWLLPETHREQADGSFSGGFELGHFAPRPSAATVDSGWVLSGGDHLALYPATYHTNASLYEGQIIPDLGPFPLVQNLSFPWFEGTSLSGVSSSALGAGLQSLGAAFGLEADFRNDENFNGNLMGFGFRGLRGVLYPKLYPYNFCGLSYASALALDVNPFFNSNRLVTDTNRPTVTITTSGQRTPVNGLLQIAFQSTDNKALHAALLTWETDAGFVLADERKLAGTNVSTTFAMPYFYAEQTNRYTITVFDQQGNRSAATTTIYPRATINRSPQPFLTALPMVAGLGQDIVFDASSTFDPEHGVNLLEFEWDFDGDGIYDTEPSTDLVVTNNYYTLGSRLVRVRVTDPAGATAVATPVAVSITTCLTTLSPLTRFHGFAGSTGVIEVTVGPKCHWEAINTNDWIVLDSGVTGIGSGDVIYHVLPNPAFAERSGYLQIGDDVFLVRQHELDCSYSVSPTGRFHGFGTGNNTFKVTAKAGCAWAVVNTNSWITITGGSSGVATGTVSYALTENRVTGRRTGLIRVADEIFTVNQWGTNCEVALSTAGRTHSELSETGAVSITTASGCTWSAVNTNAWITIITLDVGTNSGSFGYLVAANPILGPRSGVITVGNQSFTVTQAACTYSISPSSRVHTYLAATGTVSVTAGSICAWTVSNTNDWITITAHATGGTGRATVKYALTRNLTSDARSATFTVADHEFTVAQSGKACLFTLAKDEASHAEGGGLGEAQVRAEPGCSWQVVNHVSWITILSGAGGSGTGRVTYLVSPNDGPGRSTTLTIAEQDFSVSQASAVRLIKPGELTVASGQTNCLAVTIAAHGGENRLTFSLCFDTNLLAFASAQLQSNTAAGATLMVSNAQATVGRVGFTIALPPGTTLTPGAEPVVWICFRGLVINGRADTTLTMCDTPVPRRLTDSLGRAVAVSFSDGVAHLIGLCSLAESLDNAELIWAASALPWRCQTNFTHDGEDAAVSGVTPDGGESLLETTVNGPGVLSFWWKVSSEVDSDRLRFYLDGTEQLRISGEVDWEWRTFNLTAGSHDLRWRYSKNSSGAGGLDRGWIDQIVFEPTPPAITGQPASQLVDEGITVLFNVAVSGQPPFSYQWLFNGLALADAGTIRGTRTATLSLSNVPPAQAGAYSVIVGNSGGNLVSDAANLIVTPAGPLPEALDATNRTWLTTGSPAWFGQSSITIDGVDAARSGAITHSQTTTFETTVNGPGTVSFWWKVSCETNNDRVTFFVNGSEQARLSGEMEWQSRTFTLGSGAQNLRWSYSKNSSISTGADRAWVDRVEFAPASVVITAQPVDQIVDPGATAAYAVTASGAPPLTYQWQQDGTNLIESITVRGTTNGTLTLSNVTAARAGNYSVLVANPAGAVASSNALLIVNQLVPLADALDASAFLWTTNGTPPWVGQTSVTHDGTDAARSGRIGDSQTTSFQTTLTGPGTVSFWWKVSSEPANDRLRCYVNGSELENISGEVDWTWRSFVLGSGSQIIEWRYVKSSSLSVGQDRGWVDQVLFVPNATPTAPVIAVAPTHRSVVAPGSVNFTALASGSTPLTYQWFFNGVALTNGNGVSGATTTNLALASTGLAQGGSFFILVTNTAGRATSTVATLTVITLPVIVTPPVDQNVVAGATVNFGVGTLGTAPLLFQWFFNGTNLINNGNVSGVTSTNLRLTSVLATQAGPYSVIVSNAFGSVTSSVATLVISTPPTLTTQPATQTAIAGSSVTFTVGTDGSGPFIYQWRFNGLNLAEGGGTSGANTPTLTRANLQPAAAGSYSVLIGNAVGSVTSSNALLTVLVPPALVTQPSAQKVAENGFATLAVTASGTAPLTYQWRRNGANLAAGTGVTGVNGPVLSLSNALPAQSGAYSIAISNAAGGLVSSNAPLTVIPKLTLGDAVNAPYLVWSTDTNAPWIVQTNVTHDGELAAQSGSIGHGTNTWIETTLAGPGTIRFWWKVSSQTNGDTLSFALNGAPWAQISGDADWQKLSFALPPGDLTLRWTYSKNTGTNAGLDRAWLDEVDFLPVNAPTVPVIVRQPASQDTVPGATATFSVEALGTGPLSYQWRFNGQNMGDGGNVLGANSATLRLFNVQAPQTGLYDVVVRNPYSIALSDRVLLNVLSTVSLTLALDTERTNLFWRTGGSSPWLGQTAVSSDSFDAAQSSPVPNGATNWVETIIKGPIALSFWWKVSSETNRDYLRFLVNGTEVARTSGEVDWQRRAFPLELTTATVRWEYTKDATGAAGLDRGWLDRLEFLAISPLITNNAPDTNIVDQGTTVRFKVEASGTLPLRYQWKRNGTNLVESANVIGATTSSKLILSNAQPSQTGFYTCEVSNDAGLDVSPRMYLRANPAAPIGPAVNATNLVWQTGGYSWFVGTTDDSHNDSQSARNGFVDNGDSTWMRTAVTGPGTLLYWWRVSSQANADFLRFSINGVLQSQISGNQSWQQKTFVIPAGPALLQWEYIKDFLLTNGTDRGWVDDVSFTPAPPSLVMHPTAQTVDESANVTFTTVVTGGPPLTYRWRRNGLVLTDGGNVSGATSPILQITGALPSQAGTYSLLASNRMGTATSSNALLSVTPLLPLGDALDAAHLTWLTGTPPWIGQPIVQHDGVDAARSPALGDNQSASAEATVTGPGTLSFWWQVSSQTNADNLIFQIDNVEAARISGEVNWQQSTFNVAAGSHTVKWMYAKDASGADGQDRGWVDQFVFTPLLPALTSQPASQNVESGTRVTFTATAVGTPTLGYQWRSNGTNLPDGNGVSGARTTTLVLSNAQPAQSGSYALVVTNGSGAITSAGAALLVTPQVALNLALDSTNAWTTNTGPAWTGQMIVTHDGTDAARTGVVTDNGSNWMQTVFNGPGTMSFWWKNSSEPVNDKLIFTLNNVEVARISGEVDWQLKTFTLGSGSQTSRWSYSKNATLSGGQDRAWVDQVAFNPLPPSIMAGPTNQSTDVGGTISFRVTPGGTPPFGCQWQFNGVNLLNGAGISGATTTNLTLTAVQLAQAGSYRVLVSNSVSSIMSASATLTVFTNFSLAVALDTTGLGWTTNGSPAWTGHGAVTHDGVDAARSPIIGDSAAAWMETTVTGPGTASFWWKVSSEPNDRLRFYIDGSEQVSISGEVDWQWKTYNLGIGSHALRWAYTKSSSFAAGQDRGWVDQFSFSVQPPSITAQPASQLINVSNTATFSVTASGTPTLFYQWRFNGLPLFNSNGVSGATTATLTIANAQLGQTGLYSVVVSNTAGTALSSNATLTLIRVIPLEEALDNINLSFTTGGTSAPWDTQETTTHDGEDAAITGASSDSTYGWIKATVNGPGPLTFWWKVSSELDHDYLRFMLDGTDQVKISGEVDWQQITFAVPSGPHELQWRYSKNSGTAAGQDRGWLDEVLLGTNPPPVVITNPPPVVTVTNPPGLLVQPVSRTVDEFQNASFIVAANGSAPLSYRWFFQGTNAMSNSIRTNGATTEQLTLLNVSPAQDGFYSVVVSNSAGAVTSSVARLTVHHIPTLAESIDQPTWSVMSDGAALWEGHPVVTHDGLHAARSGLIGDNETSTLQTVVDGPGLLRFWWRVSSETNADVLVFMVNSHPEAFISGEPQWQQFSFPLASGPQLLEWAYYKNGSLAMGDDRGWVDQVTFTPVGTLLAAPKSAATGAMQPRLSIVDGTAQLTWTARTRRTYEVYYKDDLADAEWTRLDSEVQAKWSGTANKTEADTYTATVEDLPGARTRFYRVLEF